MPDLDTDERPPTGGVKQAPGVAWGRAETRGARIETRSPPFVGAAAVAGLLLPTPRPAAHSPLPAYCVQSERAKWWMWGGLSSTGRECLSEPVPGGRAALSGIGDVFEVAVPGRLLAPGR